MEHKVLQRHGDALTAMWVGRQAGPAPQLPAQQAHRSTRTCTRRPFILVLWPYHLCVQIVCWFYRASSGERVFDQVGWAPLGRCTGSDSLGGGGGGGAVLPTLCCAQAPRREYGFMAASPARGGECGLLGTMAGANPRSSKRCPPPHIPTPALSAMLLCRLLTGCTSAAGPCRRACCPPPTVPLWTSPTSCSGAAAAGAAGERGQARQSGAFHRASWVGCHKAAVPSRRCPSPRTLSVQVGGCPRLPAGAGF